MCWRILISSQLVLDIKDLSLGGEVVGLMPRIAIYHNEGLAQKIRRLCLC